MVLTKRNILILGDTYMKEYAKKVVKQKIKKAVFIKLLPVFLVFFMFLFISIMLVFTTGGTTKKSNNNTYFVIRPLSEKVEGLRILVSELVSEYGMDNTCIDVILGIIEVDFFDNEVEELDEYSIKNIISDLKRYLYIIPKDENNNTDWKFILQCYHFGYDFYEYVIGLEEYQENGYIKSMALQYYNGLLDKSNYIVNYAENVLSYTNLSFFDGGMFERIMKEALKYEGVYYSFGSGNPNTGAVDCSGLTQWVYNTALGINIPRTAQQQYYFCNILSEDEIPQAGDLVFFTNTYVSNDPSVFITHVGIYVGNNQMYHTGGSPVGYANINTPYWQKYFYAFGRIPWEGRE